MGLCKVYLLVEEHNGLINIKSEPAKGTAVEVVLLDAKANGALPVAIEHGRAA